MIKGTAMDDDQDITNFSNSSSHRLPTVSASAALEAVSLACPPISTNLSSLDGFLHSSTRLIPTFGNNANVNEGGGLPRGQVTEIYGPPGSGKTAFAMQVASSALHQSDISNVCWIDMAGPIPLSRFKEVLSKAPSSHDPNPSDLASGASSLSSSDIISLLSRFHHYQISTLPHLLTLFLHPTPIFPPPSTTLIVLENITSLFNISFPTHRNNRTAQKIDLSFASTRKLAVAGDLASALSKLAALRNIAILVINQTSTSIRGLNRAVLKPAIGGREWDQGISTRCVMYRDFASGQEDGVFRRRREKSVRWIEVLKGGRRRDQVEEYRRMAVPFEITLNGLREISSASTEVNPSVSTPTKLQFSSDSPSKLLSHDPNATPKTPAILATVSAVLPSSSPEKTLQLSHRKRKADHFDHEIADSQSDTDDEVLPLPPLPPIPTALSQTYDATAHDDDDDEYGSLAFAEGDFDFDDEGLANTGAGDADSINSAAGGEMEQDEPAGEIDDKEQNQPKGDGNEHEKDDMEEKSILQ